VGLGARFPTMYIGTRGHGAPLFMVGKMRKGGPTQRSAAVPAAARSQLTAGWKLSTSSGLAKLLRLGRPRSCA